MRIRIDLLKLLKTIGTVAAQVATVAELVIQATHPAADQTAGAEGSNALDLDAVSSARAARSEGPSEHEPAPAAPAAPAAAPGSWPADPSAAH